MEEKPLSTPELSRRNLQMAGSGVSNVTARQDNFYSGSKNLMQAVVERENMFLAYKKVVSNKGTAGTDNMKVEELKDYLRVNWARIKEELLNGAYQPQPVLRKEIPKAGNKGIRKLGIPVVVDRLIQQAIHQVLSPMYEQIFSDSSYGFRPGRNAHHAVLKSREYVSTGRRWVVDIDLEKFFDLVNHDRLMAKLSHKIIDKKLLLLIRKYLTSGIMENGILIQSQKGTPQGGPLSPLLSNIVLDELDKELERRGHKFCRYADDCNIYVHSYKAGIRLLKSISYFLENKLKLKVNKEKSAVGRPWNRSFLGYSMTWHKEPKLKVALISVKRLKQKIKAACRRGKGRKLSQFIEVELKPLLTGWINYFSLCEVKRVFEVLDGWIRRRLRSIIWKQWKRSFTRAKNLMKRNLSEVNAWISATNGRGSWWNAGSSHMNKAFPKSYFDKCGLVSLMDKILMFQYKL